MAFQRAGSTVISFPPAASRRSRIDTEFVCTYSVFVNLTLSVDGELLRQARARAEVLGTSINQLVREYLEELAGRGSAPADAAEFRRLSQLPQGHSDGWKFDRDELHERIR